MPRILLSFLLAFLCTGCQKNLTTNANRASTCSNFRLTLADGRIFELASDEGLALFGSSLSPEILGSLKNAASQSGLEIQTYSLEEGSAGPRGEAMADTLLDPGLVVTQHLGLQTRGEVVLVQRDKLRILYRGDVSGLAPALKGQQTPWIAASGASIFPREMPEFDYERDIVPIVVQKCLPCHREGSVAPFSLQSHQDLVSRQSMLKEVILTGRMPPFAAQAPGRHLTNQIALSPTEKRAMVSWLEQGAKGPQSQDPLPASLGSLPSLDQWDNEEPDLVLSPDEAIEVPADGILDYQYITFDLDISEDRYLKSVKLLPGEARVLHHVVVFAHQSAKFEQTELFQSGTLLALTPLSFGRDTNCSAPMGEMSTGIRIPKGSNITLQVHLTPFGRSTQVQPKLGLYFLDDIPDLVLELRGFQNFDFQIPPRVAEYELSTKTVIEEDSLLFGVHPHMHYRGKNATFWLDDEVLLRVPDYSFDWQFSYFFRKPIEVKAGSTITLRGVFDNSSANPRNPDPSQTVSAGEQSTQEMLLGTLILVKRPQGYSAEP